MKLRYNVEDRPPFGKMVIFALQQLLAILAATIAVPAIVGNGMTASAAMFGAGAGTLIYFLFTKGKSPVFLGSSFAFINSMFAAFAGGVSMHLGFLGLIIGAILAGLVYVIIAIVVKFVGVDWINKLMPAVVVGPTVAIIGLSLAGNAVKDLQTADAGGSSYVAIICGLVTLAVVMLCSTYGKKMVSLIPFIIGIVAGYIVALLFTVIGIVSGLDTLKVIDFAPFQALVADGINLGTFIVLPTDLSFLTAWKGFDQLTVEYILTLVAAYVPVAFVVFAEHIADHKNLSSIIDRALLKDPGLSNTLLGDGIGSMVGALFGGCPNTTYGESVGCVAITRNASVATIVTAAIEVLIVSRIAPFIAFLDSIPACVMGGVCISLYGFIAVSGLKMLQKVDLNKNRNLFVASVILICGIGGFAISFGQVTITTVACALILGILTNTMLAKEKDENASEE